ncbi:MAG: hypothetical protein ABFD08_06325 [Syntrophomonas sp.]
MRPGEKKQYTIIILAVILVAASAYLISRNQEKLQTIRPAQETILEDQDFVIDTGNGILRIGTSPRDEVMKIFPQGKKLGMSTIYRPATVDCLLTFDRAEELLQKMHLYNADLATSRGIKVGDSFSKVVEKYGKNYASVSLPGNTKDFDAVYGKVNNIIFKVNDNKVTTIILQKEE